MTQSEARKSCMIVRHLELARKHLIHVAKHIEAVKALSPGHLRAGADAALKRLDKLDKAIVMKYGKATEGDN